MWKYFLWFTIIFFLLIKFFPWQGTDFPKNYTGCVGRDQLTCWERWCQRLYYPLPLDNQRLSGNTDKALYLCENKLDTSIYLFNNHIWATVRNKSLSVKN